MNASRSAITILGLLGLASAAVIAAHVVNIPAQSHAAQIIHNGLHAPGFGIVALLTYLLLRLSFGFRTAMLAALVFASGLAFLSELAQYFGERDASLEDLVADLIGIAGFLTPALLLDRNVRAYAGAAGSAVLSIVCASALYFSLEPILSGASTLYQRALHFPALATFDSDWELHVFRPLNHTPIRLQPAENGALSGAGGRIAVLEMSDVDYAGLIIDAYPDWRGYDVLTFVAATDGVDELTITVRIHDVHHNDRWNDRFNTQLVVTRNAQRFEIPLDAVHHGAHREMDMEQLAQVIVYARRTEPGAMLILDDFKLSVSSVVDSSPGGVRASVDR